MTESSQTYDAGRYDRPSVTVDVVIFSLKDGELQVLLVKRRHWPFEGCWAIPGGFVQMDESLEAGARRELAEETGVQNVYLEQLYTFGDPGRDPRTRVISIAYFAIIRAENQSLQISEESTDLRWFPVRELPSPLAFDHDQILRYASDRLRSKLEYTTIAFQLLPEVFTLPELKRTYDQILGYDRTPGEQKKELDKANFYRKIRDANILEDTGRTRSGAGGKGRPAQLYRFRRPEKGSDFVFRWREGRLRDEQDE
jgi:8-oxo-dGTP diphosphatase